jgi:hypothetical protein
VAQNIDSWQRGIAYFLYLTAQHVIDTYYPLVDRISNQLNQLEEKLLSDGGDKQAQRTVYRVKHAQPFGPLDRDRRRAGLSTEATGRTRGAGRPGSRRRAAPSAPRGAALRHALPGAAVRRPRPRRRAWRRRPSADARTPGGRPAS